ncbi:maltodextrin glucosidase [Clostridia bacterium]|nr:maltodextrin glucosidase [Clostridia bacterium]
MSTSASEKIKLLNAQLLSDYFVFDAVFSDETPQFVNPPEPKVSELVKITLRTARTAGVDVYILLNGEKAAMNFAREDALFCYYEISLKAERRLNYAFLIYYGGKTYCYNKCGIRVGELPDTNYNFNVIPDFKTPDWAKGALFYQIWVDRFANGDKTNDVVNNEYSYLGRAAKRKNWDDPVVPDDIANFYGGDLRGVIDKLSYLKKLGVEVIYLSPIFVSPSTHKYDIQDYDYVDPHFGVIVEDGGEPLKFEKFHNRFASMYVTRTTKKANLEASNAIFAELIKTAHAVGMRVILDGVFNHCGAFSKWLDRENFYGANGYPQGAYRDKNSKYHDYFRWYDEAWPNNECYDGWWGHDNHPKLYYEGSRELYDYILYIGKKWVSEPLNADGWRLDVAADLGYSPEVNHKFWTDFRDAVKSAKPDALILAEHYGDASPWLDGAKWDSVMNYDGFMEPLTWFLTGMEKHSEEFRGDMFCNAVAFENSMRYYGARFTYPSNFVAMNELSNHDHSRFLTRTNMTAGRLHTLGRERAETGVNMGIMFEAIVFQMSWHGAPTIYYGDEAGLCGWTDPDNRRVFPWGSEDKTLTDLHIRLAKIRNDNPALRGGSLEYLHMTYGVVSFGRWTKTNRAAIAINNNAAPREINLPVWKTGAAAGKMTAVMTTTRDGFSAEAKEYEIVGGHVLLNMPSYSSIILTNNA